MKKLISLSLVLAMCLTLVMQCSAYSQNNQTTVDPINYQALLDSQTILQQSSNGLINVSKGEHNSIVRQYQNPNLDLDAQDTDPDTTKALLLQLGMDIDAVNSYSNEKLAEFANAKSITTSMSFIKTDASGNVTYHTADEALAALSIATAGHESGDYEDTWMKLVVSRTSSGSGDDDLFTMVAEWLIEPVSTKRDVIGISAKEYTMDPDTLWGWFKKVKISTGTAYYDYYYYDENDLETYQFVTDGVYDGNAIVMDVPSVFTYTGLKAYMEVHGAPTFPDLTLNSKLFGSYLHATKTVDFDSALTIEGSRNQSLSTKGIGTWLSGAVSVAASLKDSFEPRFVQKNFTYTP